MPQPNRAGDPLKLELDDRTGLPEDLRYLLAKYPRETWSGHVNLGDMAKFWLQRHDMFRELGQMLTGAAGDYRTGKMTAEEFLRFTPRRLQFFLQQLHGHHMIEDQHYFPVFAAAESGLKPGFELLDSDHHVIDGRLHKVAEKANALFQKLATDTDGAKCATETYAEASDLLIGNLMRHLEDEEDLIIPVILDRGEASLGVG